jgi:hypothetical protein
VIQRFASLSDSERWLTTHVNPSDTVLVRASDFVLLATSRRKLLRADEPRIGVRGLVDPQTGNRYLIETSRLRIP